MNKLGGPYSPSSENSGGTGRFCSQPDFLKTKLVQKKAGSEHNSSLNNKLSSDVNKLFQQDKLEK